MKKKFVMMRLKLFRCAKDSVQNKLETRYRQIDCTFD